MAAAAARHVCAVIHGSVTVLITNDDGTLAPLCGETRWPLSAVDLESAHAAVARGERCINEAVYLPLPGSGPSCAGSAPIRDRVWGVMVVRPRRAASTLPIEQLQLLDAFAVQLALSLQRARLAQAAEAARIAADRVLLRNTLLASISHDLRTPLTTIAGAGSLLAQPEYALNVDRRATLGLLIERKARDMSSLLTNVLELMQMESASCGLRGDWHSVGELVALALRGHEARLCSRRVLVDVPSDLPLVRVEAKLIVQLLGNLLDNAAKYTPPGTTITLSAALRARDMVLVVADDGPGLPPGEAERVFERFARGGSDRSVGGVGLGLAICRAAARLHGGEICAKHNPGGGARFEITLPLCASSPAECGGAAALVDCGDAAAALAGSG